MHPLAFSDPKLAVCRLSFPGALLGGLPTAVGMGGVSPRTAVLPPGLVSSQKTLTAAGEPTPPHGNRILMAVTISPIANLPSPLK